MSYDAAANAANESQKRIARLEAERDQYKQDYEAELDGNRQLRERFGAKNREGFTAFIERVVTENATLRAQAERDAAVVEAAEGLIEHYAMDGELTMWLANDPGAEELCAAAPGAAGGEMATRWRAKHQKAKRQLQYAAQYGFYAPPVSVHYFDDYSRYGQGDDDDDWPDYDEFDDDGGDCFHCGGKGWIDGYEDDPLWFAPGEMERCTSCHGTGLAKDMTIW